VVQLESERDLRESAEATLKELKGKVEKLEQDRTNIHEEKEAYVEECRDLVARLEDQRSQFTELVQVYDPTHSS